MNLKRFWYPILISKQLKKNKLIKAQIFGEPYVLYRDESNNPVCLEDRCPHRGTPLSLGKIWNGQLECSYHGWRFGENGTCLKIPTLTLDKQIPGKAHARYRACIEKHGAIWVLPEAGSDNTVLRFQDHFFPTTKSGQYLFRLSSWDVPVSYDLFIENLFDLSHLPFVHHNTLSRRSKAQPITFEIDNESDADFCGIAEYHKFKNVRFKEVYKFMAPCMAQYEFISHKNNSKIITQFYCVPFDKQKTRILCYTHMDCNPFIFKLLNNPFTLALGMPIAKLITKQDVSILQGQNQNRKLGVDLANQPVQADLLVSKYRKWATENNISSYWFQQYDNKDHLNISSHVDA